ncbi:MAG: HWE histidine kinase domain-containing protein [Methylocystis sp.]|uniref:sensor histidine kinase n=1 Tax=Methylocystis sp. TaxID=1911079 RepID=UPI003D0D9F22
MPIDSDVSAYAKSILATVSLPLLALDKQLTVEIANDAFLSQFQVTRQETIGRPIYELGNGQWNIPQLRILFEQILERDSTVKDYRVEHDFEQIGRRAMRLNAKRIRRPDAKECILLAISDETERELLKNELDGRIEFAEKLVDSVREALLILHWDLKVHSANRPFYRLFDVDPEATEGRLVYELGNGQWNIPELRRLLEEILPRQQCFDDYEVEHAFDSIGRRVMLLNGRRLDHLNLIVLAIRDITDQRNQQTMRREREARQNLLLELNDRLRSLADPVKIQTVASEILARRLGADHVVYAEIDEAGEFVTATRGWSEDVSTGGDARHRLANWGQDVLADLKRGQAVAIADIRADPRTAAPETQRFYENQSISAVIHSPLIRGGRLVAALAVYSRAPRIWSAAQASAAEAVAELVWSAVARARTEQALHDSEARYRLLFNSIDESFTVVEPFYDENGRTDDYRFIEVNQAFETITRLKDAEGRTGRQLIPSVEKEWIDTIGRVAATGASERVVRKSRALGKFFDAFLFRIEAPGNVRVAILSRDVTEAVRAEEQRTLLMRELNHRSKNLLSIVLAIARATAGSQTRDFEDRFQERILSLSANQDLLVACDWQGVSLHDLVRSQLAHLEELIDDRITLQGPPLTISAAASQSFSMALHELATNAVKYGALSNADGRVAIEWGVGDRDGHGRRFKMCWRETDGPAVSQPTRGGFGSTVIRDMIRLNLRGDAKLEYDRSGIVWEFNCPVENVVRTTGSEAAAKLVTAASARSAISNSPRTE